MSTSLPISILRGDQYLEANEDGYVVMTVLITSIPPEGMFLRECLDQACQTFHLKSTAANPHFVCFVPGDSPTLASLTEEEWKAKPDVVPVVSFFESSGTYPYSLAVFFNIRSKDKVYNYYLKPQDCSNIDCPIDIIQKDITGLTPDQVASVSAENMNFNSRVGPSIPRQPQDKKGGIDDIGGGYLKL